MNVNVNIVGVAAVLFVVLLVGAILYLGGGTFSDVPLIGHNAKTVESVGAFLLFVGVISAIVLIVIAIYKGAKP